MTIEKYSYPPVLLGDIDPADPYQANIIYDVITAVRALDAPNYKDVSKYINGRYNTSTIVKVLRWSEKQGYITGWGGVYIKNGGGAKMWRALRLPTYPYTWLDGQTKTRSYNDIIRAWSRLGYYLVIGNGRVMAISKDEKIAIKYYKECVEYDLRYLLDDDSPELYTRDTYAVYKNGYKVHPPLLTVQRGRVIYGPHDFTTFKGHQCQKVPDCRHCKHNHGVLYQLINSYHPRILNNILCDCRPHPLDRVWHWWHACDCRNYEPWDEQYNPVPPQATLSD